MTATRRFLVSAASSVKRMLAPFFRPKTLPGVPSRLNTLTCCGLNVSFWPCTWNVPAPTLTASSVPRCMPEPASAVAAHAALIAADATKLAGDVTPGMGTVALDGAAPGRAPSTAVDFIGTPGADNVAAGRVTDAALGAVDLVGAADAVPGRVSGAVLIVAAFVAASGVG